MSETLTVKIPKTFKVVDPDYHYFLGLKYFMHNSLGLKNLKVTYKEEKELEDGKYVAIFNVSEK